MSDETTQFIIGDAALDATGQPRKRRFFRRKKTEPRPLTHCENCGAELTGEYCAKCGQHAIDYRRSLLRVLVDAADSFFNWDTKFIKSVGVLLVRPWRLTNDFNAGRRARYVHPLRLYLLASIAFFLIAKMVNFNSADAIHFDPKDRAAMDAALAKLAAPDSALDEEERAKVEAARVKLSQSDGLTKEQDQARMKSALGTLLASSMKRELKAKDRKKLDAALARMNSESTPSPETKTPDAAVPEPGSPSIPNPNASAEPNSGIHFSADADDAKSTPGIHVSTHFDNEKKTEFENWLGTRIKDKVGEHGTKVKLFLETLRSNIPTMMLCCIPLFAFVLKILYFRQRRFYVEHLVYALHIHTFAYLGVTLTVLIGMAAARWSDIARVLICTFLGCLLFWQVYLSIRRVYGQGWFFTTFKFLAGGLAYLVILVIAVGATAFVTLLLPD